MFCSTKGRERNVDEIQGTYNVHGIEDKTYGTTVEC